MNPNQTLETRNLYRLVVDLLNKSLAIPVLTALKGRPGRVIYILPGSKSYAELIFETSRSGGLTPNMYGIPIEGNLEGFILDRVTQPGCIGLVPLEEEVRGLMLKSGLKPIINGLNVIFGESQFEPKVYSTYNSKS